MGNSDQDYFVETYAEGRIKFRALLDRVRLHWPDASLESHMLEQTEEDLATDIIRARPLKQEERLLVLSCGLHGIEGYIGSATIRLFVEEYLQFLDPQTTGLILICPINPWGMANHRRVNENNVDLNRNFIYDRELDRKKVNSRYREIDHFLNPTSTLQYTANPRFYFQLISKYLKMGSAAFREAVHMGQYRYPKGLYYGGQDFECSAKVINSLFREAVTPYSRVLLIDMHSGYGPRYQMTLVNSIHEERSSEELVEKFKYPLVVKTNPEEFYQMQGDMVDYFYLLMNDLYPEKHFYATSFEFGTYGQSFLAGLRSLRTMINENCLFHNGSKEGKAADQATHDFKELFYPEEGKWRIKALQDARQAFSGILQTEGYSSVTGML